MTAVPKGFACKMICPIREVLQELCLQTGFDLDNPPRITTGGMKVLQKAFHALGWEDPYPTPWRQCQHEGCQRTATCGQPTPEGYKRLCGDHSRQARMGTEEKA